MKRRPTKREALVGGISLAITVTLCIFIIQHRGYLEHIARYGYIGCFITNILASGTIAMPGLGMIITFTLGGVLNPAIVGAVAGIGEAVGAVTAYFTGYSGRGLFRDSNNSLYLRFNDMLHRHGSKGVFFMASIINPFYYPFALFMGMIRFGFLRFFLATWAGRTIKNMVLAYLGYFGLRSVLQWLGLSF
ncbi:MAG: VTT domain-containing protein [Dehalococcoidia bacterium]|nr:VTT domain-containing protein [Dehalococcoidia bacterium]